MIRIAICDDQTIFIEQLETLLTHYSKEQDLPLNIDCYTDGTMLLAAEDMYELIFLDIDMPELDGMSVAKELRARGSQSLIVFVTSHQEHVFNAFEVNAFRFLVKPAKLVDVSAVMGAAVRELAAMQPKMIAIELYANQMIQLPVSEIKYVEALSKATIIHTTTEVFESKQPLKQLEDALSLYGFFRTHKSYLVNLKHVKSHTQQEVTLLCGESVHLSRLKAGAFRRAFIQALKESL